MGNKIIIVQGAQWGSESKGMVAHALAKEEKITHAVRTGSINAGHSIILENGTKYAFQQLPTPCVIPGVKSVIGPGAYINHEILCKELDQIGPKNEVVIDVKCGVHLEDYTAEAQKANRSLKIGATGKGCAESIVHKIKDRGLPNARPLLYTNFYSDYVDIRTSFDDTAAMLNDVYDGGGKILIEGTQGTLLDFHCGPYPFVTSRQTIASAWVTEAGLSPSLNYEVVLVARTYPIRVAGNSGPMTFETNWPIIARKMNSRLQKFGFPDIVEEEVLREFESLLKVTRAKDRSDSEDPDSTRELVSNTEAILAMQDESRSKLLKFFETTTVTKRLRRIAELDTQTLRTVIKKERPAYLVLTFLNYLFPEMVHTRRYNIEVVKYLEELQAQIGCWIKYVTIGPKAEDMIETPRYFYGKSLESR